MRVIGSTAAAYALAARGLVPCPGRRTAGMAVRDGFWVARARLPPADRGPPAVVLGTAAGRQGAVPLAPAGGRRVRRADRALPDAVARSLPAGVYVFVAAVLALVPAVVATARGISDRAVASAAQQEVPADLKEYEPAGFPQDRRVAMPTSAWSSSRACRRSSAGPSRGPAASLPRRMTSCRSTSTRIRPPKSSCVASIILCGGSIRPCLWWRPIHCSWWRSRRPSGRHTFRLQRAAPSEERIGRTISGVSLVLLLAWAAVAWRGRRSDEARLPVLRLDIVSRHVFRRRGDPTKDTNHRSSSRLEERSALR